ncbi:MAG: CDP-alcohol phosphatidyltransferase family protein [Roseiflexaceae bacterium]|nr:CDP-alcohol phosphatidyltransferase family protein [Roseiflexaceae bacterium]
MPFAPREFAYPSNLLTFLRLLLLPFTLWAMRRRKYKRRALALLGAAILTDAVDGPLARQRGEVSVLGKLLDPVADKLLIDGAAVMLSRSHGFPWWATIALLGRDLVILAGGVLVYQRQRSIVSAHPFGKLTTIALSGAMLLYLADGPRTGKPALFLALLPFGASMYAYGRSFVRDMRGRTL